MTYSLRNCILEHSCVLEQLWGSIPVCEVLPRLRPAVQPTQLQGFSPLLLGVCQRTPQHWWVVGQEASMPGIKGQGQGEPLKS